MTPMWPRPWIHGAAVTDRNRSVSGRSASSFVLTVAATYRSLTRPGGTAPTGTECTADVHMAAGAVS